MPGYAAETKTSVLAALAGLGAYISLHNSDPGANGAHEIAGAGYARQQTAWPPTPSPPNMAGSQVIITVPANTTVSYWGVWDQQSGGNYREGFALPSPVTYTLSGPYPVTPTLAVTG